MDMSPGGEEWLCQEAGLPSEYAARLRAEGLSLRLLASAKLPERRDVLRPMGLLYGQIMAINRRAAPVFLMAATHCIRNTSAERAQPSGS